jgi:hypothetical protein
MNNNNFYICIFLLFCIYYYLKNSNKKEHSFTPNKKEHSFIPNKKEHFFSPNNEFLESDHKFLDLEPVADFIDQEEKLKQKEINLLSDIDQIIKNNTQSKKKLNIFKEPEAIKQVCYDKDRSNAFDNYFSLREKTNFNTNVHQLDTVDKVNHQKLTNDKDNKNKTIREIYDSLTTNHNKNPQDNLINFNRVIDQEYYDYNQQIPIDISR